MKRLATPVPRRPSDEEIRARLLAIWTKLGPTALAAHCGGQGLVVGCPVCGRRR